MPIYQQILKDVESSGKSNAVVFIHPGWFHRMMIELHEMGEEWRVTVVYDSPAHNKLHDTSLWIDRNVEKWEIK